MSYDLNQFRSLVVRTLDEVCLRVAASGIDVTDMILGTAAQESSFGHYLHQLEPGPGLGAFSIEPETFRWLREHFLHRWPDRLTDAKAEQLEWDLRLGIFICRLRYLVIEEAIPRDLAGMASYWKRYYNTSKGRGTVQEFTGNYMRFILGGHAGH